MSQWLLSLLRLPLDDFLAAIDRLAVGWRWQRFVVCGGAAVLSWWIYVPLHELAHALGCVLGGGTVSRLDLDPLYGAAALQRIFPFVNVGSDYAGQLSGFDTHGSDATYLLTDLLPFLGTILVGVPLLRAAGRSGWNAPLQAVLFGAALPSAFAPFISLTGDYYEMGSILVSDVVLRFTTGVDPARWRSDDVFKLAGALFGAGGSGTLGDAVILLVALACGTALAFLTYGLGAACANAFLAIDKAARG